MLRLVLALPAIITAQVAAGLLPPSWDNFTEIIPQLSTPSWSTPYADVNISYTGPRSKSMNDVIKTCWSINQVQLSSDVCRQQALTIAMNFALAKPPHASNVYALGAERLVRRSSQGYRVVRLRSDGDTLRPRGSDRVLTTRSLPTQYETRVEYDGALPDTFLLLKVANDSASSEGSLGPVFVATDGHRHEVAHLRPLGNLENRDPSMPSSTFGAGEGLKIQSRSGPVTEKQHVDDWLNSASTGEPSVAVSLLRIITNLANSSGYMAIDLVDRPPGQDGKAVIVAESEGFGREWEDGWNWCFGTNPMGCDES